VAWGIIVISCQTLVKIFRKAPRCQLGVLSWAVGFGKFVSGIEQLKLRDGQGVRARAIWFVEACDTACVWFPFVEGFHCPDVQCELPCGSYVGLGDDGFGVYMQFLADFLSMGNIVSALPCLMHWIDPLLSKVAELDSLIVLFFPRLLWGRWGSLGCLQGLELGLEVLCIGLAS